MDYGKAISFVFQDDHWIMTILVGGVIILAGLFLFWTIIGPFVAFALVSGYMMQLIRAVRLDPDANLPTWENWSEMLTDGAKLLVVEFIWQIPWLILFTPIFVSTILSSVYPDSDALAAISVISMLGFGCFAFLYMLFYMFVHPAITINLTINREFLAGLDFGAIFRLTRAHLADVFIILLILYGIQYVANFVGMLMLMIGLAFTSFWVMLVRGHLYGQLARLALPPSGDHAAI